MKWRGSDDLQVWKLVFLALLLLWFLLLWETPPSEGLWKDVRCDLVYNEDLGFEMPQNCYEVYRLYPDPFMWFYEFFVEPISGVRQDW